MGIEAVIWLFIAEKGIKLIYAGFSKKIYGRKQCCIGAVDHRDNLIQIRFFKEKSLKLIQQSVFVERGMDFPQIIAHQVKESLIA